MSALVQIISLYHVSICSFDKEKTSTELGDCFLSLMTKTLASIEKRRAKMFLCTIKDYKFLKRPLGNIISLLIVYSL